jgi:hypothetical protein
MVSRKRSSVRSGRFSWRFHIGATGTPGANAREQEPQQRKGEATMLKNTLIALGIAALTSTSAFAATKAPKTAPATHKVAQAAETKPTADKADKKVKKDKKVTEAAEKAPAPAAKVAAPRKGCARCRESARACAREEVTPPASARRPESPGFRASWIRNSSHRGHRGHRGRKRKGLSIRTIPSFRKLCVPCVLCGGKKRVRFRPFR